MNREILCLAVAAASMWALPSSTLQALPLITSVIQTGGDDDPTDTIEAKFTGQTWARVQANEPTTGAVGSNFTMGPFQNNAPAMVDRNHVYTAAVPGSIPIPSYLAGGEYIMIGNDNRDNPELVLDVTVSDRSFVYLLIDNRLGDSNGANPPNLNPNNMQWVIDGGWEPSISGANRAGNPAWPDEVGIDEGFDGSINQWYSVYVKTVAAGTFQLFQPDNAGQNMYGVVVRPVPKTPTVSTSRGDLRGVTFAIRDGSDTQLNPDSVVLTVNNQAVSPVQKNKTGQTTVVAYRTPVPYAPGSTNRAVIVFADNGNPVTTTTNILDFVVANYPVLSPALAVASVDTSKPGFKARVYQYDNTPLDGSQNIARGPGGTGLVPNAERQIAGGYLNPENGQPYPNVAATQWVHADGASEAAGPDGAFVVPGVVNWNGAAPGDGGNFSSSSTPPAPDDLVPGIPGTLGGTERYVVSIEALIELKAGAYRFGVNSDDGFRLSAGWGPGDVLGVQLATAGDRGFTDTTVDFAVTADGFYPFRLMYFQSGGGHGCEFFVANPDTGTRTLINDLTAASPIKAYRESSVSRPYVSRVLPAAGEAFVHADRDLVVDITDGAIPLDAGSVVLRLNGNVVPDAPTKNGSVTTIRRAGSVANLLASGANNLELVYAFTAGGTTISVTNRWSFTVPPYTTPVPAAYKVAAGSVTGTGFNGRIHQMDRSLDANQGNGGRYPGQGGNANDMPRPEIQISGGYINRTNNLPFPNLAVPGGNPDGTHEISDVINWNSTATGTGNSGIFNGGTWADVPVPGLPGTGSSQSGIDNTTMEIVTYLELKAGAHLFAINCDDGFVFSAGANPRDTLGTFLGARTPGGGNSGSLVAAAAFNVIIPEDGIYPFRLLWWQGGGGVNLEFMTVDKLTGQHVLVNDFNSTRAVKAYSGYNGATRPWVKFSVYPLSSRWQNQHQQSGPGPIRVSLGAGNPVDIANEGPGIRPFGDAVGAVVADLGSGSVGMVLNGVSVTPTVSSVPNSNDKLVTYVPNPPLAAGTTHTAGLVYAGATNFWSFTVITNVTVPSGVSVPVSAADANSPGFRVKVVQAAAARPGGNTAAAAEAQLAGTPASVALPGPEAEGTYAVPGIINWNVSKNTGNTPAEIGNFQPLFGGPADEAIPGIPGTGLTGNPRFENVAAEIFAWLELPAGYQKFGVGGDDGWKVQIGRPGQTDGPVLFSIDRGAGPRDIPFAFIVPEAGLYPVRLVWYQGTGGGNLEFFTYGPNNQKIPVNDRSNPNAVKAYRAATTGPTEAPEITSVTVVDGTVTVVWKNGGTLYSSGQINGGWTTTGDSDGTFSEPATGNEKFYRVQR